MHYELWFFKPKGNFIISVNLFFKLIERDSQTFLLISNQKELQTCMLLISKDYSSCSKDYIVNRFVKFSSSNTKYVVMISCFGELLMSQFVNDFSIKFTIRMKYFDTFRSTTFQHRYQWFFISNYDGRHLYWQRVLQYRWYRWIVAAYLSR